MSKAQYLTGHLGINSKVTESSGEQAKEFRQFKRSRRSCANSESESRFERIDVPGDGSCLFWSVTMAYLIPVRNDDALFRQRYLVLFGNEGAVIQNLDRIRNLVRNSSTANYDDTFANLVSNVFRNRVVDHISSHGDEFRGFIEGNFESYLENMREPDAWGGEPEIRAISGMLRATISVSGATESRYENGNIQIQLFYVGAPGKQNHYNFGLERNMISNNKELVTGFKRAMGKGRPQDFELIQLLIEEAGKEVGISRQDEGFKSFEPRFQSFVDQISSYLHSVEKAGFLTHFFLGSFSTLLDTEIAEKLNIKKIYFSFDTSKILKVAVVKNGKIVNAKDAINNIDLFSISESNRGHKFTADELQSILRNNIDRSKIRDRYVENEILNINDEIQDRIKSRLVQIYKGKDGIFVNMKVKGILDSPASKEFHEIEKGIWSNPEGDIEKLANSDKEAAKQSLERVLGEISKVHSKYENSLTYDSSAREAAHHGFMVGVFMNFHYRYNLRVYLEQFAGRGYADIILLARGPDRALDSIPIIIEVKVGEGPNATPDKALQQAEKYVQGFQPNVQRVLTTADEILCVGVNLDNPSPVSDIKVSNRGEEIIPLFQDMLKSADDWDTQRIGTIELRGQVKDNLERIYHTFPGTPDKGDNHYFSRFLLGQSLLLNRIEDLKTGFKKYIFIYGNNIPTEVHPNPHGPERLAAQRSREALSTNLDASHAVVTMVLIPENTKKLSYVINIVEANRKNVLNGLNEELPLDRLNREIGNRKIVELNLNFDTRYKSNFKRYLTVLTEKYNSLQEYSNGADRFQGTFKEVPYPSKLKETFDQALDAQSLSINKYNKLFKKIGEGIFPFRSLVNKEAHFQGILNGVFSYYSDLKLQESPETRALVLTEFQTGRGERTDMLVHGIKFVAQGGNAKEYTPIGLELKISRQGKGAQALLREANDQINEKYKEGVTYKTLTDGDEVKFIGVVLDKGSNNPNKIILTSKTAKEGFIPVEVVHSSVHMLPTVRQCSKRRSSLPEYLPSKKQRTERSVSMASIGSFDEEKITEEEKEQRIKELFNADKVAERVKNIEFYDQLFNVSQKISEGEIIDKNVEEAFVAKIKDVDLNSIDPEIREIVKERIVDDTFDFESSTNITYPFYTSAIKHNSRITPSTVENYNVVCGPLDDDIIIHKKNREILYTLPSQASCRDSSPHRGGILNRVLEKWSLQEHSGDCYNAVTYRNTNSRGYGSIYYIPAQNANVNIVFQEKDILNGDRDRRDDIENRYYFEKSLDSCKVCSPGKNFFHIAGKFSCDLGADGQKNIVIIQGNLTTDSINVHSIIGSNRTNYLEFFNVDYVDGEGGNDVITAKNFTTRKGYFGDSIYGKGLVLLPINFSNIDKVTYSNDRINIYSKSGAFISVDKQTSVKTADGLFVTPTKIDDKTGVVTNLHVTKSLNGDVVLDDELDNLRKIDNLNFNITKQLSSANYHSTIGSPSNHIFYPDKEHHNFYWEAPSNISHLYLFDNSNVNIRLAQANGILDFSQLNCTLDDMPFTENNEGEIKINRNSLHVTILPDYKDVTVTFDGGEYYKFQNGELERDCCSDSLKIDGRFSVNGTDLLNHHNCFTFDSDKVLFLKLNNNLLLLSDRGALSISNYYSSVHKNWDLSVELNNRIIEPEEFGERADEFSSFRYYKLDEQWLQIYHNQPINKDGIGLVDFRDKSILGFDIEVADDSLVISYGNSTISKVENWSNYQPAREMMFAFNDTVVSNSRCIVSICNSEDVIVTFNKEKAVLLTKQVFDAIVQSKINIAKDLVKKIEKIDTRGNYELTLLYVAIRENRLDVVKLLFDRKYVSVKGRDAYHRTLLHWAIQKDRLGIVKFLLDEGADIEAKDINDETPLHIAVKDNNKPEVIRLLLDNGARIEAKNKGGWTPLHYAAYKNNFDICKLLLERDASIEAKANDDRTPLDIANCMKHSDVVEYLKKVKEERGKPVQRRRRHHHGDHNHHGHLSRNLLAIDLSNQPEIAASSGTRPSSWINDLFGRVKSPMSGLLDSKSSTTAKSPILQIDVPIDVNGTIMLLDVLVRKVTGQKYISTEDQHISPLEAQGYALNITKGFEKVVEQATLKSGISIMHRLNVDYTGMQKEITQKVMSGKFNEISGVLKSYVEKACPGEEAGKLSPKKFEKFIAKFNKSLLNQLIEQISHNRDGRLEVDGTKQMSLEPQSYLSNASVHSHSKVSTCLSGKEATKLGGNINR